MIQIYNLFVLGYNAVNYFCEWFNYEDNPNTKLHFVDNGNQEIHDKNILDSLSYEAVEEIWNEYQSILHLSAEEVSLIYTSAQKYFNDTSDEYYPVLPEILEIDYILKGLVSLTRNEFNSLSNKEFEMMQLVLAAKNEMSKKI